MDNDESRYIVVFDGVCHFCNSAVNFIIQRDPKGLFAFTPMQSAFAQQLMDEYGIENKGVDTFMLVKHGKCVVYSSAALEIAKDLTGWWHLFTIFKLIPEVMRDAVYVLFAKNRYRLFGRQEVCMIPTEDVKSRFVGV